MITKNDIISRAKADYAPSIVRINEDLVRQTSIPKKDLQLLPSGFQNADEWYGRPVEAIAFFIALNSINYRFWDLKITINDEKPAPEHELLRYDFLGDVGSAGMTRAFHVMWSHGPYLSVLRNKISGAGGTISEDFVRAHFGDFPDMAGRVANLNDVFKGSMLELVSAELLANIEKNGSLSVADAQLLHDAFPQAYHDYYYKRSQLAMAMIAGFFAEKGAAIDISGLTGFADYQIPRIARGAEYLIYSDELANKVDNLQIIKDDSVEERAIRAATILLMQMLAKHNGVADSHVDSHLFGQRRKAGSANFHLTMTDAY